MGDPFTLLLSLFGRLLAHSLSRRLARWARRRLIRRILGAVWGLALAVVVIAVAWYVLPIVGVHVQWSNYLPFLPQRWGLRWPLS
jgi:hypothetical protein